MIQYICSEYVYIFGCIGRLSAGNTGAAFLFEYNFEPYNLPTSAKCSGTGARLVYERFYFSKSAIRISRSLKIPAFIVSSKLYCPTFSSCSNPYTIVLRVVGFTIQYSFTPAVRYLKSLICNPYVGWTEKQFQ